VSRAGALDLEEQGQQYIVGAGYVDDCFVLAANYVTSYNYSAGSTPPTLNHYVHAADRPAYHRKFDGRGRLGRHSVASRPPRMDWPWTAARIEQVEKALRNMTAMPRSASQPSPAILLAAIVAPRRARPDHRRHGQWRADQPTWTSSSAASSPSCQPATAEPPDIITKLIDEKGERSRKPSASGRSDLERHRTSPTPSMAPAHAAFVGSAHPVLDKQGVRPDTLRARIKGRHGLGQPGARPLQGEACRSARRTSAAACAVRRGKARDRGLRVQDAAGRAVRARGSPQASFDQRKKEAEALRERVTSCAEANSYFKSMQNATIRDIVTKTSADTAGIAARHAGKTRSAALTPPEVTKQGVEMVACALGNKTTIDTPKKKECATRCSWRNTSEVEVRIWQESASRDDRIR